MAVLSVFGLIRDGGFAQATDTVRRVTGGPGITIARFAQDHATAFSSR